MQELLPWLSLKSVPGVGNLIYRRLIERFGSPGAALSASATDLATVKGITRAAIEAIQRHRASDALAAELETAYRRGYRIVTFDDPEYPPLLRQIPDPPPYLYVHGRLQALRRTVSVVGSRHATDYGLSATRRLCADLAACDIVVVSGMARGIDTAAHEGALSGGGDTIAVLGSGLGRIYPPQNRRLFEKIARQGAVLSEFPMEAAPDAHNFPQRNRIISGMSLGTVVVEATRRSGSLITAALAAEQNREVFAVPGSIRSFKSTGTHTLIKQGAKLVEHAQDVIEELQAALQPVSPPPSQDPPPTPPVSETEARVMGALSPYPVHIDALARKMNMAPGKLAGALLQLEIKGLVQQSAGKQFSLK